MAKEPMKYEDVYATVASLVPERLPHSPPPTGAAVNMWPTPYVVVPGEDETRAYASRGLYVGKFPDGRPTVQVEAMNDDDRPMFYVPASVKKGGGPSVIEIESADPNKEDVVIRPVNATDGERFFGKPMTAEETIRMLDNPGSEMG